MLKHGAKGQGMVVDMLSAVLIFLLIVGSVNWAWSSKAEERENRLYGGEMNTMATRAIEMMVGSSGRPANWETKQLNDVNAIGLMKSNGVLDEAKLNRLIRFSNDEGLQGIVGFWKFDSYDTEVVDSSGNGNNGLWDGATWLEASQCKESGCASFNGSSEINVGNSPELQVTGDMSIVFWAYPTNILVSRQNPIDKAFGGEFALTMETDGDLSYYHGKNGGEGDPYISCGSAWNSIFENDTWVHIALVRDISTRTMTLYKNGQAQAPCTWAVGIDPVASMYQDVTIGKGYIIGGGFRGRLDEVAIFNKALSGEEIQEYKEQGMVVPSYERLGQKLLIGANDYYFRLVDPSIESRPIIKNSSGELIEIGTKTGTKTGEEIAQITVKRPVVFAYKREGEEQPVLHEAIAELTLSNPYWTW